MMNLNKAIAVSMLMVGISSMSVYAAEANNEAGSVHVSGSFVDASCLIKQSDLDRTLSFDELSSAEVSAVAQDGVVLSKNLQFNITDCPGDTNHVGVKFGFEKVDFDNNYIKNTGLGHGALFGISKGTDSIALAPDTAVYADAKPIQGGAVISANVNIYRTAEKYAAGTLTSTANVTLVYN